jgi:hypothetical protein
MKFLEYTPLSRVSAFLQRVNLGDCVVQGEIQAYSCAPLHLQRLTVVYKPIAELIDQLNR